MKRIILLGLVTFFITSCANHRPVGDELSFSSYFGEGFGRYIMKDVYIKEEVLYTERQKSPPRSQYFVYKNEKSSNSKSKMNEGIRAVIPEELELELQDDMGKHIRVIGYETIIIEGQPLLSQSVRKSDLLPIKVLSMSAWQARKWFVVKKWSLTIGSKKGPKAGKRVDPLI